MPITEAFTGTETVSTTEWSLTTDTAGPDAETSDGAFQVFIDFNALAAADVFEIRLYEKVLSGSTQRSVTKWRVKGVQSDPVWISPVVMLVNGWDFTLKKISGSDQSIDWSIRKAA